MAQTAGYTRAFAVSAILLVVAALIAVTVLPARVRPATEPVRVDQKELDPVALTE